jgi:hypothetical protein
MHVTVGILLIGYNRWDLLEKRLSELATSHIDTQTVYLSLDGLSNGDLDFDRKTRIANLESLVLPFTLSVIQRPSNLGCSNHIVTAVSEVLSLHEQVIVIEDDVSISPFFISSMTEALSAVSKFQDVGTIGGFSNFHKRLHFPFFFRKNYWRKTKYFSAWGWGTTAEFWRKFERISDIENVEEYLSESPIWTNLSKRKQQIWLNRFRRGVWDYNLQLVLFKHEKLNVVPALRLIDNEGFSDDRSTHTKHKRPGNLFGIGKSDFLPVKYKAVEESLFLKIFWGFVDSNLWAADGYFNSRGRAKGLRTRFREFF